MGNKNKPPSKFGDINPPTNLAISAKTDHYIFRCGVTGADGVGKTSLIYRYVYGKVS